MGFSEQLHNLISCSAEMGGNMWLHSQSTILDLQLWLLLSVSLQCRSVLWPCEKYILHMLFELDHMILSENFSMNLFFVSTKCKIRFECPCCR